MASQPASCREYLTQRGVRVVIFNEGCLDLQQVHEKSDLCVWYVGRLPGGAVFDCTRGKKGKSTPFEMRLGVGQQIPGMEEGLQNLHVGAKVELYIPNALAYVDGIPPGIGNMIPPGSDVRFEVELLRVDSVSAKPVDTEPVPRGQHTQANGQWQPRWMQCEFPPPLPEYVSFCKHLARHGLEFLGRGALERATALPRMTASMLEGWDGSGGAVVCVDMTRDWSTDWSWDFFKEAFGQDRVLAKWVGPIFAKEKLWEKPVFETSLAEYVEFVRFLEIVDPECLEENAARCPRLYLNGWQFFLEHAERRPCVRLPCWIQDATRRAFWRHQKLIEGVERMLQGRHVGEDTPEAWNARREVVLRDDWELVKLFLSPKGSITRLHYDNGEAHAWLTQLRGRKLFVCYPPEDGEFLSAHDSSSPIDPLAVGNEQRWAGYEHTTPFVTILEEGDTILVPVGVWHYAVSLTPSITLMRNFWTPQTVHHWVERKEDEVARVAASILQKGGNAKLKGRPLSVLQEFCKRVMFANLKLQIDSSEENHALEGILT